MLEQLVFFSLVGDAGVIMVRAWEGRGGKWSGLVCEVSDGGSEKVGGKFCGEEAFLLVCGIGEVVECGGGPEEFCQSGAVCTSKVT